MARFPIPLGRRGEVLVAIQFLLMVVFIAMPSWNPLATPALLEALAVPRMLLFGLLGLFGLALGVLGSLHLRDYLTPLPYPVDHSQLVRHGVYGLVRHPLYSSQLFAALGWVLYSLSLTHAAILVVGFLFFDFKATKEEAWLTERHPEYPEYARLVRKFVPWIY